MATRLKQHERRVAEGQRSGPGKAAAKIALNSDQPAQLAVDTRDGKPVSKLDLNNASAHVVTVPHAIHAFVTHRLDGGSNDISVAFSA